MTLERMKMADLLQLAEQYYIHVQHCVTRV